MIVREVVERRSAVADVVMHGMMARRLDDRKLRHGRSW